VLGPEKSFPRIALTGGPGGGKTTFLEELRKEDPDGEKWLLVPEAATILIKAGLRPGDLEFQRAVVRLQLALEDSITASMNGKQVAIFDRGTLDSLAYWLGAGGVEEEFYEFTGLDRTAHIARYDAVLHLETPAIKAPESYVRSDSARRETHEQAADIDIRCKQTWADHPCYTIIEASAVGWTEKAANARRVLEGLIRLK